ncbi:MAG: LuxR C-terminal-related transcriptional regulator [Planctomycetota bacterium]
MPKPILQTLIVEDDCDHAELLQIALSRLKDLEFEITRCMTCTEAVHELSASQFDLVFLDYWLDHGETGDMVLDEVQRSKSCIPVVVTSSADDIYLATTLTRAGASRYLCKRDLNTKLLSQTIREALQDSQASRRDHEDQTLAAETLDQLTPREREVAGLIAEGLLSKQIAGRLGCAEGTINLHRSHIMSKTGAQSVADVVRMVLMSNGKA